jgi:hypothetical protein
MVAHDAPPRPWSSKPPRWLLIVLFLGIYLSVRGYHSRDSDQAYRLPLLLHRQDSALFAGDPFVRSFDAFNPHRGYLALLDAASRPLGLSVALFALFALTFGVTCAGLDRLARAAWPEAGDVVGLAAIGLVLTAKAGNIGTVHLFEAMLLDRLIALGLGWLALAWLVDPRRSRGGGAALLIGLAAVVHPSFGLQLAMLAGASWLAWALVPRATGVSRQAAILGVGALGLALVPWGALYLGQAGRLYEGLPPAEFLLLCAELQSPQHMLPHLWRLPQWLALGCTVILAVQAMARQEVAGETTRWPCSRVRLTIMMAVNLAGLGLAWLAVEVFKNPAVTVFQPFRMATVFRGLALIALSGRIVGLWRNGGALGRARALLVAAGLAGDWRLVVATVVELSVSAVESVTRRPGWAWAAFGVVLGGGVIFLTRHDTESGHLPLLAVLAAWVVASRLLRGRQGGWNRRRLGWALGTAWALPVAAVLAASGADPPAPWAAALIERCRFAAVPTDDIERLALWCRDNTPTDARFIGPPGPKTFRLWSERSLAFNRAGSPYHARGLADWAARFRAHVAFEGSSAELVRAYQHDRHALERRYLAMSDADHRALAVAQGAGYVVAAPPAGRVTTAADSPLELLHIEGGYAVYRVRDATGPLASTRAQPGGVHRQE